MWDCGEEERGLLPDQVIINEYLPGQGIGHAPSGGGGHGRGREGSSAPEMAGGHQGGQVVAAG